MPAKIKAVEPQSLAYFAGLEAGDTILSINGIEINDYLDYAYASANEEIEIILKEGTVKIDNEDFMPLGIVFDSVLIDKPKSCRNKCVFCFIDQLPDGMRETCYFKDDDYRLSFLQGNYISMTNMEDSDVDRIIKYSIPRINISVHTTNPELRCRMLNNKNAGKVLGYLKKFADNDININAQIVLCPGFNDKSELDRTILDLSKISDSIESLSVVPVGLSDHRKGLVTLIGFTDESAKETVIQIEKWQKKFKKELGRNFVYIADEFYITAKLPLPSASEYDGFPQIENGVGLCSSLIQEYKNALSDTKNKKPKHRKTVVTGKCVYEIIKNLTDMLDGNMISVIPIENNFFGKSITVTGLLTGEDIINQLNGKDLGDMLLLSSSMFRHGENVLLDDTTSEDIEKSLNTKVVIVENDGYSLLEALLY